MFAVSKSAPTPKANILVPPVLIESATTTALATATDSSTLVPVGPVLLGLPSDAKIIKLGFVDLGSKVL